MTIEVNIIVSIILSLLLFNDTNEHTIVGNESSGQFRRLPQIVNFASAFAVRKQQRKGTNKKSSNKQRQQQKQGGGFLPSTTTTTTKEGTDNVNFRNINTVDSISSIDRNNGNINCNDNLQTPEDRMEHIRSRIQSIDLSSLSQRTVPRQQRQYNNKIDINQTNIDDSLDSNDSFADIDPNAICIIDHFVGSELCAAMRHEAESIRSMMIPSQSSRWDETSQSMIAYNKVNVLSTQIEGGSIEAYQRTPRLIEYIVTLTSALSERINAIVPVSYQLSTIQQTNKLAVCLGDGSYYDKHIDNMGGTDNRKLTALLYLQPPGLYPDENITIEQQQQQQQQQHQHPNGGYLRAYDVPTLDSITCIAPQSDRLVLFWSDSLVHDVSPSYAPGGIIDHRWALTVWFIIDSTKGGRIRNTDPDVTVRHFGNSLQNPPPIQT
jgi:Rps23 Pro-64 3,4-dihydroxylase Tpa1-like proline 4-hydroxylase